MLTEVGLGMRCELNVMELKVTGLGELAAAVDRVVASAGLDETICRLRLSGEGRLVPVRDVGLTGLLLGKRKKDVEDEEETPEEEEEDDDLEDDEDEDFEDDEEEEDEFEEEFEDDELDDDDDDIFYDDDDDE